MIIIIHILLLYTTIVEASITCRGPNNSTVDWFVVYKLPRLTHRHKGYASPGVAQVYMDDSNRHWTSLKQNIDQLNHPVYYTLNQIYEKKDNLAYAMYNDEVPEEIMNNKPNVIKGHTKGDIAFDNTSGFWLIHSVPKFPPPKLNSYSYPKTGMLYGQTFLCVSLAYSSFNHIGTQFLYNYPDFYEGYIPDAWKKDFPALTQALKGGHSETRPYSKILNLQSLVSKVPFVSFAKSDKYNEDLYDGLVGPYLKSNLLVETWRNGGKDMPSCCSTQYTIENILSLKISNLSFATSHDHAKWAISKPTSTLMTTSTHGLVAGSGKTGDAIMDSSEKMDSPEKKSTGEGLLEGGGMTIGKTEGLKFRSGGYGVVEGGKYGTREIARRKAERKDAIRMKVRKTIERRGMEEVKELSTTYSWTCIGDINRQFSQEKRGGGTICFNIPYVNIQFYSLVTSFEKCQQNK